MNARRSDRTSNTEIPLTIICGLLISPYFSLAIFGETDELIGFFPDDAFYYLETARHFLATGFPTFDGINPTNGFHPFYFAIIALLAAIAPAGSLIQATFTLHIFLLFLSCLLLLKPSAKLSLPWRLIFASLLTFPATFLFAWISAGMESSLVMLFTVLLLESWTSANRRGFADKGANLKSSIATTGFMLSRLDLILPLAPFTIWAAYRVIRTFKHKPSQLLANATSLFGLPLLAGIAYLALNLSTTDHLLPISAAVKQAFFIPFKASWLASTRNGSLTFVVLASAPPVLALLLPAVATRLSMDRADRDALLAASCSVFVFYGYLIGYASNFFRWYFVMPIAVEAWMIIRVTIHLPLFRRTLTRRGYIPVSALLTTCFLANWLFTDYLTKAEVKSTSWHLMTIGRQLDDFLSEGSRAATFDAGSIGYFSSQPVINLDGLANNYDYLLNYRAPGKIKEYLHDQRVTHFLLRDDHAANREAVLASQYERVDYIPDSRLQLLKTNELFRYSIPDAFTVIAFRIEP